MKNFIAGLLLSLTLAIPAQAQNNCATYEVIEQRLTEGYGEQVYTQALGQNNTLVQTYANLETGTWSVVVTSPQGTSCLVAAGQSFELINPEPLIEGDPT